MIMWGLLIGFAYLTDGLWALALATTLAVFFPRLTQVLFATVIYPVWLLWVSLWMFLIGWGFDVCSFSWDAFTTCIWIAAVPVGLICAQGAEGIKELQLED